MLWGDALGKVWMRHGFHCSLLCIITKEEVVAAVWKDQGRARPLSLSGQGLRKGPTRDVYHFASSQDA